MRAADFIVDIGPGAGEHGGEVVATGTAEEIMATEGSITGDYLAGRKRIPVPESRRKPTGFLTIKGAAENNLKKVKDSAGNHALCDRCIRFRQEFTGE